MFTQFEPLAPRTEAGMAEAAVPSLSPLKVCMKHWRIGVLLALVFVLGCLALQGEVKLKWVLLSCYLASGIFVKTSDES